MLNEIRGKQIGIACVLLATLSFSLKSIFVKFAYEVAITPISLLVWRTILAFPFFLLPLLHSFSIKTTRTEIANITVCGLVGGLLYLASSFFDFVGLTYIGPTIERAVLFTFPVFVTIILWVIDKKIQKKQLLLVIISQLGLLIMLVPAINEPSLNNTALGVGLVFLSALLWAFFMVFSSYAIGRIGALRFTSAYMCVACIILVLIALILHPSTFSVWSMGITNTWPLLALSLLCTIMPSYLTSYGIRQVGARMTAIISGAGPIITLWCDRVFFGRLLLMNEVIGSAIVAISITTIMLLNKPDVPPIPEKLTKE